MKIPIFIISAFLCSGSASAADPALCEMFGSLAKKIAEDREQGVPYSTELKNLNAAAAGLPSTAGITTFNKGAIKTIYLDMPKLSPEGAYKLHYVACISAK